MNWYFEVLNENIRLLRHIIHRMYQFFAQLH